MTDERLEKLRALMRERGVDVYLVPTADFHESEYVGAYFKAREYLTGFTGSAGTAVITQDDAALWTDGRYFIQAEREIQGSGFRLMKMGVPGFPTVREFVKEALPEGGVLGFDGRCVNARLAKQLLQDATEKQAVFYVEKDLVGEVWDDRPALPFSEAWLLPEAYSGESTAHKLARVREKMKEYGASAYILTSLDDIAWLLNLRANDIPYCPVLLSYLMLTTKGCVLYASESALDPEVRAALESCGITIAPYADIYKMADRLAVRSVGKVLLNPDKVNYRIYSAVEKGNEIVEAADPTLIMKAVKNPTELDNIRRAHVKDGVAMVKWIYWLKNTVGKEPLDEFSAEQKLEAFRKEQEGFVEPSFKTICAYKDNAAMMHYNATKSRHAEIFPEGFLLVDSGGHYLDGSIDITRTIVMGPLTEEEKHLFTLVLRSNLSLAAAHFLEGVCGLNLDILARGPLWEEGIDYRCGTGHGIGYLLNVHEAPNGFRWRVVPERNDSAPFEPGMVTTDEPGVYMEGKLGIRTENELITVVDRDTEYGRFLKFETVTLCPIDLDAVLPEELSYRERSLLNAYHKKVYEALSPYLSTEEKLWLRYETREV